MIGRRRIIGQIVVLIFLVCFGFVAQGRPSFSRPEDAGNVGRSFGTSMIAVSAAGRQSVTAVRPSLFLLPTRGYGLFVAIAVGWLVWYLISKGVRGASPTAVIMIVLVAFFFGIGVVPILLAAALVVAVVQIGSFVGRLRYPLIIDYRPADRLKKPLDPEGFDRRTEALKGLDFSVIGEYVPTFDERGAWVLSRRLSHPNGTQAAIVEVGRKLRSTQSVQFTTRFDDGLVLRTTNGRTRHYFRLPGWMKVQSEPGVKDPARLMEIHATAVANKVEHGRTALVLSSDEAIERLRNEHERLIDDQIERGLMVQDRLAPTVRFTFLGSLVVLWRTIVSALAQGFSFEWLRHPHRRRK